MSFFSSRLTWCPAPSTSSRWLPMSSSTAQERSSPSGPRRWGWYVCCLFFIFLFGKKSGEVIIFFRRRMPYFMVHVDCLLFSFLSGCLCSWLHPKVHSAPYCLWKGECNLKAIAQVASCIFYRVPFKGGFLYLLCTLYRWPPRWVKCDKAGTLSTTLKSEATTLSLLSIPAALPLPFPL